MTQYWVVALIVAIVVVLFVVRRVTRPPELDDDDAHVEVTTNGLGSDRGDLDDTAPAVLSPPEWAPPKSVSNGSRRKG